MDKEQLLEQFDALYTKTRELDKQMLTRSALKVAMEAKRFAKTHHMLIPYIHICFLITNMSKALFEPEIGADNAMEIIALVESEEKARKFQNDYDQDHYDYTVHWVSACAYDNLAVHTATRNGFNSPIVHGAVDDGIHVCRRTGKLECVECFREYAVEICMASGNYEMGEHYARLCATSTAREHTDDRRYVGYLDLINLSICQGKLHAAVEILDKAFGFAETYHSPQNARIELSQKARRVFLLGGRETELEEFLIKHGVVHNELLNPSLEEHPDIYQNRNINEALVLLMQGKELEAAQQLAKWERYLLSRDILNYWFPIRVQRIAALLIAQENDKPVEENLNELIEELRERASKASEWSAIASLDAMLQRRVKLNPLGISCPIDLGPYATEGTPVSHARLELMLPLFEKVSSDTEIPPDTTDTQKTATQEKGKSPLEQEVESWLAELTPLWQEEDEHKIRQQHLRNFKKTLDESEAPQLEDETPFEKEEFMLEKEKEIYAKIMAFSPETQSRPNQPPIAQDDFFVLTRPLMEMRILRNRQRLIETWAWLKKFVQKYPETGRLLSTQVFFAYHFSNIATEIGVDPKSLNIPLDEELEQLAAKAFALEPNRTGVATTAGLVFQARGNLSEAQRCFSRACQLDRKNEYATSALVKLYEDADRPKDALATIDFYARAGGRHPFLLWKSMQIAFQNEMAQPFLLYYGAYVEEQEIFPQLESQRIWALIKTQQYDTALKSLDYLDDSFKEPARDRFYTRALCQIEGKNDEAKFLEMVEAGLNLKGEPESEGLLGTAFEPCAPLWSHVKNLCSQTDLRRFNFEKFLYERGLLDWEFFARDDEDENENDETEKELRGHYRCILIQPLSPEVPAYAGWVQIPRDEKAYAVTWLVLAENEDEAKKLALDVQNHCYILPAEVFECEKIDSYYSDKSMVTHQGNRFPAEQLSHEA